MAPSKSVPDATRFTPTAPHAASRPPASRFSAPAFGETPEQRVARLRAAHLAAKNAQESWMDRIVVRSRHVFDTAHRFTVMGLIGFSGALQTHLFPLLC